MIPTSITRSLARQDLSVLCEIKDHVERLISEMGKTPPAEELPGDREVLEVHTTGSTTYRLERVSCGKNCKGCPHGPYWYGYWREGGKTRSKYIGKNLLSIFIFLIAVTIFSGCVSQDESSIASPPSNASHRINVVTTIAPLGDFVKTVGGEKVLVTVVVPPGAEPHTFEPTPSLIMNLAKADLYVMNGAGLEFWMNKLLEANKKMVVVDSSRGVALLQEGEGEIDPHVWISLRNAAVQVNNICSGLIAVDPANKDYYINNRDDYLQKLQSLDEELNQTFSGKKMRIFIVHHPAWTYFARDYDLSQVPLMQNEKEPGPKYLGEVIDLARKNNITTIFVEPEYNPKAAEVIAQEMNTGIVTLDPLAENYLENMAYAGREIAKSLA